LLLVTPGVTILTAPAGFHANHDVSVHAEATGRRRSYRLVPNTLADLTKREYRFAHLFDASDLAFSRASPAMSWHRPFPFDVRRCGQLRLPTLWETSQSDWWAASTFVQEDPDSRQVREVTIVHDFVPQ
jgi:hypothetical protein